jgi:hypothetical protein
MEKKMNSGYTFCACRDCFETIISNDMSNPDFCDDCIKAGCEPNQECQSMHSYGMDSVCELHGSFDCGVCNRSKYGILDILNKGKTDE